VGRLDPVSALRWLATGLVVGSALVVIRWSFRCQGALRDFANATGWGGPRGWEQRPPVVVDRLCVTEK
jgi:hypothetical protein